MHTLRLVVVALAGSRNGAHRLGGITLDDA
jgi:hypothetical protein